MNKSLWPCQEETETIWKSIYVFTKGQMRVRRQEVAHSVNQLCQLRISKSSWLRSQDCLPSHIKWWWRTKCPGSPSWLHFFPNKTMLKLSFFPPKSCPVLLHAFITLWVLVLRVIFYVCFLPNLQVSWKQGQCFNRVCISHCPGKACHVRMARHHWLLPSSLPYVSGNKLPDFRV